MDLKSRLYNYEQVVGTWCNLGSPLTVEQAGIAGFDWVLLDQEHGPGDNTTLLHQIHALGKYPTAPIVRIGWRDRILTKRALDLGAAGIMFPYIETATEAEEAVSFMRYAPDGVRGLASGTRCAGFGAYFSEYYNHTSKTLICVAQIESSEAVKQCASIAAVPGIDVLFVGPLDLSANLGMPGQFAKPAFVDILRQVVVSAAHSGKATGILVQTHDQIRMVRELGFTFIAIGGDSGAVRQVFTANIAAARAEEKIPRT